MTEGTVAGNAGRAGLFAAGRALGFMLAIFPLILLATGDLPVWAAAPLAVAGVVWVWKYPDEVQLPKPAADSVRVAERDEPRLFDVLREGAGAAADLGNVRMGLEARVWADGRPRELHLGLPLLVAITPEELRGLAARAWDGRSDPVRDDVAAAFAEFRRTTELDPEDRRTPPRIGEKFSEHLAAAQVAETVPFAASAAALLDEPEWLEGALLRKEGRPRTFGYDPPSYDAGI